MLCTRCLKSRWGGFSLGFEVIDGFRATEIPKLYNERERPMWIFWVIYTKKKKKKASQSLNAKLCSTFLE
jgi:hypothetical protein